MSRVLIAGCGYVGNRLGEQLVAASHDVWGLRRRPTVLAAGIRPIAADLGDLSALQDLPADLDTVFYLASASGAEDAFYRAAYVDGIRNLLAALEKQDQHPERVFFVSSTSVYEQSDGEWVDEDSTCQATHFSGQRLLEGEAILARSPVAGTVVRFGGIYGPRRMALVERVRSGRAVYREGPPRYTNRIHRDDCSGVLAHLMQLEAPETVYLAVDCEPVEEIAVLRWLAGALGAPEPRPANASIDTAAAGSRRGRSNKRCRNTRLLSSGYVFRYPSYREGYASVLAELR